MKETLYYYVEEGSSKGPVTAVQLAKLITPDTLVWTEGMSEWVPANKIEEVNKAMAEVKKDVKIPEPPAGPTPEADPVIQPAPQKTLGSWWGL